MPRARTIKPGFHKNEKLGALNPLARILFSGLWMDADKEGRMEDRPRRIKAEWLPYDECNIEALLNDLYDAGFILRYQVDGERYIQIPKFSDHQNPHPKEKASVIPEPLTSNLITRQVPENPEQEMPLSFPSGPSGSSSPDAKTVASPVTVSKIAIVQGGKRWKFMADQSYSKFVELARKFWSDLIEEDLESGWQFSWRVMDFEQKAEATRILAQRIEIGEDSRYVARPPKYLENGAWKRKPREPTVTKQQSELPYEIPKDRLYDPSKHKALMAQIAREAAEDLAAAKGERHT